MGHEALTKSEGEPTWRAHLRLAIALAGGQHRLAALCGVSQNAIWVTLHRKSNITPGLAIAIAKAMSGGVTLRSLAPELFAAVAKEVERERGAL